MVRPVVRRIPSLLLAATAFCLLAAGGSALGRDCGLHAYEAQIVRVIDGDTVVADVRLGFGLWAKGKRLRLAGIDAPELRGEDAEKGARARAVLAKELDGATVRICTLPDRKDRARTGGFGRTLAIIWREQPSGYQRNINTWMVLRGYAEPFWRPRLLRDLVHGA